MPPPVFASTQTAALVVGLGAAVGIGAARAEVVGDIVADRLRARA